MVLTCSYGPDKDDITLEKVRIIKHLTIIFDVRVDIDHCGEMFADLASTMSVILVILSPAHLPVPHGLHIWLSQCLQYFNIAKPLAYLSQDGR